MGLWKDHNTSTGGYYNCNRFEEQASAASDDSDSGRAKRELDRYLHYYKRYATHEQSGKFAEKQRAVAEERMESLQDEGGVGWMDVQFIQKATEQLIECREVLKYTYAFAYYLPPGPKKDLFEYNQAMLESHTERLSELSETPLEKMNRAEVIDFTTVTRQFVESLLRQVEQEELGDCVVDSVADWMAKNRPQKQSSIPFSKKRSKKRK